MGYLVRSSMPFPHITIPAGLAWTPVRDLGGKVYNKFRPPALQLRFEAFKTPYMADQVLYEHPYQYPGACCRVGISNRRSETIHNVQVYLVAINPGVPGLILPVPLRVMHQVQPGPIDVVRSKQPIQFADVALKRVDPEG